MATKVDKKNAIRQGIIEAAIVYSQSLAGKTFLYVYGDEYFEASFPVDHFLHLTGVETRRSATVYSQNAPMDHEMNDTAKKQYNLLLDVIDLCAIYY